MSALQKAITCSLHPKIPTNAARQRYPATLAHISLIADWQRSCKVNFNYHRLSRDFVSSFLSLIIDTFVAIKVYTCYAYKGNWIGLERVLSLRTQKAEGWGCVLMGAPPSFSQIPTLLWHWVNVSSCSGHWNVSSQLVWWMGPCFALLCPSLWIPLSLPQPLTLSSHPFLQHQ